MCQIKDSAFFPVIIDGQAVETAQQYKYLGTRTNTDTEYCKLTFNSQVIAIYEKAHQPMFLTEKAMDLKFSCQCFVVLLNLS